MRSLSSVDLLHLLIALSLILVAAHALGTLAHRLGQPRVVGEILGGLLLGPTVFGALAPGTWQSLFGEGGSTGWVLGALYQLGLMLLMFCSGSEMRASAAGQDRKTVGYISTIGVVLPFAAGLLLVKWFPMDRVMGSAQHTLALTLVFAVAIAVTSIPVISRIFLDLDILDTPFARIVVSAAVVDDILLYAVLTLALAFVGAKRGDGLGPLASLLGIDPTSAWGYAYPFVATAAFAVLVWTAGGPLLRRATAIQATVLRQVSPTGALLIFLLLVTTLAMVVGVGLVFGALTAGLLAAKTLGPPDASTHPFPRSSGRAVERIKDVSFAFFVPLYFALIGLRLNLRHFDIVLFVLFFGVACLVKSASVFGAAKLAGESNTGSRNLAVAMNARGGPGLVLASVAYDAKIVSSGFYMVLVVLALLTSVLAGSWLSRIVRLNQALR